MTKILYVYGEDYAALSFDNLVEAGTVTARRLWDVAASMAEPGRWAEDDEYFEYEALEFSDIDPEFIEWVLSIQDYDDSKHAQFYVVED